MWNSNQIDVDEKATCFVGKNEAGKTALLTALYRSNPIIPADAAFDETYDYPKREVEDYLHALESKERNPVAVVECEWLLDQDDIDEVEEIFGPKALRTKTFKRSTYYGKSVSKFSMEVDEDEARAHLIESYDLADSLKSSAAECADFPQLKTLIDSSEMTGEVKRFKAIVDKVVENGLAYYVFNQIIWPRAPKFLYFDEYYQLQGCANLNALVKREQEGKLEHSDYPLLGLINLARLDHNKILDTRNTAVLKNKLEGAGNHLTGRIIKYWSQNKHIQMKFDVRDAKPEDPLGMQSGINIWGEVYDTVHWATTPLGSRSRGFVWFFSFLAWYEDVKRQKQNVILLLDEPGLSLHGRAQADLLRYFEEELSHHQVIYSTHSPFMVDPNKFDRVRIVQDLGVDATEQLPNEEDGTKVVKNVFDATEDSLFPLQGALGYEIQQTLFVGPNTLIVEGPSDLLYIRSISSELEREGRIGLADAWVICPVGGCGKVPAFVSLLAPQKGMKIATLLDIQKKDKELIEGLYKKKILEKKNVITYADFLSQDSADVEDMFDRKFYLELVSNEYKKQLNGAITSAKLKSKNPRVISAIETYIEEHPLKSGTFSHYRPARYFAENIGDLWPNLSNETKDRFEEAFMKLNALLG